MPIFDSSTIARLESNAEQQFAAERPCIVDRVSITLVSGTALYDLPSYLINIRRVTYQGWKVYPLPHRDLRQSYLSGTQKSRPLWYIFNNVGQAKIQLFPVPSASLAGISGTALWGSGISSAFVIEFYRMPVSSDTTELLRIPGFFRRNLLKCYINKRAFAMEGKGQNLKASKYWSEKFEMLKNTYGDLLDDLNNKPRNLVASDSAQRPYGYTPPPPILPVNRYGIGVDEPSY